MPAYTEICCASSTSGCRLSELTDFIVQTAHDNMRGVLLLRRYSSQFRLLIEKASMEKNNRGIGQKWRMDTNDISKSEQSIAY